MDPPNSYRISRGRHYLGKHRENRTFRLQDCHLLWFTFPGDSTRNDFCNSLATQHRGLMSPTTPSSQRMLAYMNSVWALSISLAATEEVEVSFLSWGYLDVSVHPVSPSRAMYSLGGNAALPALGCPIRKSPDQSLLATPQGLSQRATSFIASNCQGIHRIRLVA